MNFKLIFYAEASINVITLLLCFFAPEQFIKQLVPSAEPELFAIELTRWYGLVLLILTGILLVALKQKSFDFLRAVLLVNLPGDLIQIALAVRLAQQFNQWNMALIFTAAFCIFLFISRMAVLKNPELAGYQAA